MDQAYMASIVLFAGNFAPRGWAFCNGQILAISSNSALFSLLGTTYGGNGSTTFALPDLRSRVPVHSGNSAGPGLSPYLLGESRGTEHNTLNIGNMASHTHMASGTMSVSDANATLSVATQGASLGTPGFQNGRDFIGTLGYNNEKPVTPINGISVSVGPAGGSQPVNNIQPCLGLNYIICMEGIYPTRD